MKLQFMSMNYEFIMLDVKSQCYLKFQLKMFNKEAFRSDRVLCAAISLLSLLFIVIVMTDGAEVFLLPSFHL